ncbi:hypothetical protein HK104_000253 [Borealophlyctis nickersoniae]|nr:hypothetical protein HK104_000253 [Borealophlyctis nickersoniae]
MYPRKDGDFVVFQCLKDVMPFEFGEKDVTLEINACFKPKGCDGWGSDAAFKLFPSKRVKFVGSAVEGKGSAEDEDGGSDGGWGVGDDEGWGGGDDEGDEPSGGNSTSAVGDDGSATLEGNGVSVTCQVARNVCKTDSFTISELSVPTVKIPLPQFYSMCIKGLRAKHKKDVQMQEAKARQEEYLQLQREKLKKQEEVLEKQEQAWKTTALPMLEPYITALGRPQFGHLKYRCAATTHEEPVKNLSWARILEHLRKHHSYDFSETNPLPNLLYVSDPGLNIEIRVPQPEDLPTTLAETFDIKKRGQLLAARPKRAGYPMLVPTGWSLGQDIRPPKKDHRDDCVSESNRLPSYIFVGDPGLEVEIPLPTHEDLATIITSTLTRPKTKSRSKSFRKSHKHKFDAAQKFNCGYCGDEGGRNVDFGGFMDHLRQRHVKHFVGEDLGGVFERAKV